MKAVIILAHPSPGSFNHAIADTACQTLQQHGHAVFFHDLYQEEFDPLLSAGEIDGTGTTDALVARHCTEAGQADGIIIVHPNWWGQPPAILKGWVDRVLQPGVAYTFLEGDAGEGRPRGLLPAQVALVFNTSNTPREREYTVFGDPLENLWRTCIFDFCGVTTFDRRMFSVVVTSTLEQRQRWLQDVAMLVSRYFPLTCTSCRV